MVIVSEKVFEKHLKKYINEIKKALETEKSTEKYFYPILKEFVSNICAVPNKDVLANPVEKWGMPDFILLSGELILGYIEAKNIDSKLEPFIKSEQITRYRNAFPNICLTNFREFIFFSEGSQIVKIKLCEKENLLKERIEITRESKIKLRESFLNFFSFKSMKITDITRLINSLSRLTTIMKDIFMSYLEETEKGLVFKNDEIESLFKGFKISLIDNITHEEFADILAQTICYSLLLAVVHHEKDSEGKEFLTIFSIWKEIPQSIPVLVELYTQFMIKMPKNVEICCNSIIQLLNNVELDAVFSFYNDKRIDPTIYFYEKFLETYNPKLKKIKGVYYTPIQIVNFIVYSVDNILEQRLGIKDGLVNQKVSVLDPCAGTLTFILQAINCIYGKLANRGDLGIFNTVIKEHILKNFYAFELMVTAYAISHFKLRMFFRSIKYPLGEKDKFQLYLTNTLETRTDTSELPGFFALTTEGRKANQVKTKTPIFVILGNPPYKVGSTNRQSFIENLMLDYRPDDKQKRENLQPLSDDYIKFIRFSQWKISENTGGGIVAFITNNNFLRGRIHRGIRKSLLKAFDEIFIYDLHGDVREEKPPINKKNENVFKIQTGVCIFFLIKYPKDMYKKTDENGFADIYYGDVWGTSNEKTNSLKETNIQRLVKEGFFEKIKPGYPYFFFDKHQPSQEKLKIWDSFFTFREDIFHVAQIGVQTSRDQLSIDFLKERLVKRFKEFKDKNVTIPSLIQKYDLLKWKGDDWTEERIKSYVLKLRNSNKKIEEYIRRIHYRPFDFQYIFYQEGFVQITARERAEHLKGNDSKEFALVVGRSGRPSKYPWDMVLMVSHMPDQVLVTYRGSSILCPLHYKKKRSEQLSLNIKKELLYKLRKKYRKTAIGAEYQEIENDDERFAERVMYYIYGILNSNAYRNKWQVLLDYYMPRIPFTTSFELFLKMSIKGEELAKMHMFDKVITSRLDTNHINFPISGTNKIEKLTYDSKRERLEINETQYFSGVKENVWNYRIGGYQVINQWLKRRKGYELKMGDLHHVKLMVIIIEKTISLSEELDDLYRKVEQETISKKEEQNVLRFDDFI
ncbi:MAG: type ISP restriction/modification enzyme [Candidatus Heimdallarchaeaceae archaeon]